MGAGGRVGRGRGGVCVSVSGCCESVAVKFGPGRGNGLQSVAVGDLYHDLLWLSCCDGACCDATGQTSLHRVRGAHPRRGQPLVRRAHLALSGEATRPPRVVEAARGGSQWRVREGRGAVPRFMLRGGLREGQRGRATANGGPQRIEGHGRGRGQKGGGGGAGPRRDGGTQKGISGKPQAPPPSRPHWQAACPPPRPPPQHTHMLASPFTTAMELPVRTMYTAGVRKWRHWSRRVQSPWSKQQLVVSSELTCARSVRMVGMGGERGVTQSARALA